MKERKFIAGNPMNIYELVEAVLDGEFVIENGKTMHSSFMISRQLRDLSQRCRRGFFCKAIPNPKHPENTKRNP